MAAFDLKERHGKLAIELHATLPFHVVVLQRTAKKCTKIPNAHAQPLFCSLNLLLFDVLVAVAVVVC